MARHKVAFTLEAQDDLLAIYDHVAIQAGAERAFSFVGRIERACARLAWFPGRGAPRDDIRPHLRILGVERRTLIAYRVGDGVVVILRVLHGGQDLGGQDLGGQDLGGPNLDRDDDPPR